MHRLYEKLEWARLMETIRKDTIHKKVVEVSRLGIEKARANALPPLRELERSASWTGARRRRLLLRRQEQQAGSRRRPAA